MKKSPQSMKKPVCRICFKDLERSTLISFFDEETPICLDCFRKMKYQIERGTLRGHPLLSLGLYQEPLSSLLLQFKESRDVELGPVFLSYFRMLLRLEFSGYFIVPVPSSPSKTAHRGFAHLEEMMKPLHLPFLSILSKDEGKEQKKKNALERRETASLFHLQNGEKITGKKILLADDVITTGSSLLACLRLLEPYKPKKLQVLAVLRDSPLEVYEKLR